MKEVDFLEIVNTLNQELYDKHDQQGSRFSYRTDGYVDLIYFDEHVLWCSEDDDRDCNDETGEYESFLPFIKRCFNGYVVELHSFRFRKLPAPTESSEEVEKK